jgi:phosphoribosylanthranilate isomerase
MTRVKIDGFRTPEHALAAAEAGADFVGMIFAESRRQVSAEEASEIVRALGKPLAALEQESPPPVFRSADAGLRAWFENGASALDRLLERKRPLTVGVFVNTEPEEINAIVDECGIDLVQLSGDEPWSACLKANRQVIKVLHVRRDESAEAAFGRIEAGSAIAVLLDRADATAYGGTGRTIDWREASQISASLPVWLAGGLTPENVVEAVKTVRPWCVDVSSGVETEGVKDAAKIRAFVAAAKGVLH